MRLPKFLITILLVTVFSLLYVWQQNEIFCVAYQGQRSSAKFQDLLDQNSLLRYNLKTNTSLIRLGDKAMDSGEFQMPDNYWLVKLNPNQEEAVLAGTPRQKETVLSRIFGIKREAEANTINTPLSGGVNIE